MEKEEDFHDDDDDGEHEEEEVEEDKIKNNKFVFFYFCCMSLDSKIENTRSWTAHKSMKTEFLNKTTTTNDDIHVNNNERMKIPRGRIETIQNEQLK